MGKSGEAHYAAGIAGAAFLTGLLTAWIGRKWLQKGVSALSEDYFDKILAMEFNYGGMFLYSLWKNGKRLILYWMAQLTVFGLPCTVGVIAYTGMAGGLFAGVMAAETARGAINNGLNVYVKHFAVNEQETNRSGVCTWLTEQSLREIYLKPFEMAVKEGGTMGMMSSFNRIGTTWTGGDYRLLTEILRNEWGFQGMVITDFNTEPFMDTKQMAYAGGDLNLATTPHAWEPETAADYTVLRTSVKNILYALTRSNAMNGHGEGAYYLTYYAWWEVALFFGGIGLIVVLAAWGFFVIWSVVKQVKREEGEAASAGASGRKE